MFSPNSVGQLKRVSGRDVHARPSYAPAIECPFAPVNLDIAAMKTSVRADSSASRGAADETVVERGKILVAKFVEIAIGDRFEFDGYAFNVASKHTRRSVLGDIDHFECDLELLPA